eukprot:2434520-Prymnesium_polylepis.1
MAGSACLLCDALLQARTGLKITPSERVALVADLAAGCFYVLAAIFGGYFVEKAPYRFGNVCWLVGSLFSTVRPSLFLRARYWGAGMMSTLPLDPRRQAQVSVQANIV